MTLPEVREQEAPPGIAATYAALRAASGVPLVNLIWRHFAALPGGLDWAWATLRPVLEDGTAAGARDRLAAGVALPPLACAATGLDAAALEEVRNLIAVYNRGNQTNLVLLTALRRLLEDAPNAATGSPQAAPLGPPLRTPPPLPKLAELPETTRKLVEALGAHHEAMARTGVIPSLWLHLAHWPALLAGVPQWLAPMLAPGVLPTARRAAMAQAEREGDLLRRRFAPPGPCPQRDAMLAALRDFTTLLIPDMVPMGLALEQVV